MVNPAELERFHAVEEIFYAAVERPPGIERDTLVRSRCGADDGLRTEVAVLLENHEIIRTGTPDAHPNLPRFGAWQAVKEVGRGGMGTVYLAERADGTFRMSAAVKVVPLALASVDIEERFRRERQFLAALDHPRIARLIDGGVSGIGLPYLVMEFVPGLTIEAFCDVHQLDSRSRIALFRQVLEALAYVHSRQVIHRDVKPSNILVNASGDVKLLDFGTARLVDATAEAALTRTGVFALTPEYASPELARGEPVTAASDLYAAGILLYRLLTGHVPYRVADRTPTAAAVVISRAQPDLSGLDAPLAAVLAKALRKNAASRYQTASEMDADLARYLLGQPVHAPQRRHRWLGIAAGLLVTAVLALLAFRALRPSPNPHTLVPFNTGVPNAMQPALSRDGKWLAFASPGKAGGHTGIWLKAMPDGIPRRVTDSAAANDEPSLSPDGQWFAFHSARQPAGIYLQPAAGSGPPRLLAEGGRNPRFSPDGKLIAFLNVSIRGGDPEASNTRMLYVVPVTGGAPVRLARNASSVQGAAWKADGSSILYLATDEQGIPRLWNAPLDGGPASLIVDFEAPLRGAAQVCAATADRLFYTAMSGHTRVLNSFAFRAAKGSRYAVAAAPSQADVGACSASADSLVLAEAENFQSSTWVLPLDAESAVPRGLPVRLTDLKLGDRYVQFAQDGAAFLFSAVDAGSFIQTYPAGTRRNLPGAALLSADGAFVLLEGNRMTLADPEVWRVKDLKSGAMWGRMQTNGVPWDLSSGGQWMLAATAAVHRAITAWDTRSAEHLAIYAHPTANLYLATFTSDAKWVMFTSENAGGPPHMWAAPFRGIENVPQSAWVDLGEGDYPRWSPSAGRIYFALKHDGFTCIYTRTVDPVTKRPDGPVTEFQHLHDALSARGLRPGTFRLSVARDKIAFPLGERVPYLLQLR